MGRTWLSGSEGLGEDKMSNGGRSGMRKLHRPQSSESEEQAGWETTL